MTADFVNVDPLLFGEAPAGEHGLRGKYFLKPEPETRRVEEQILTQPAVRRRLQAFVFNENARKVYRLAG